MKIISKFKDYYDYLKGIYGVDEKLILDRTDFKPIPYIPSDFKKETLHIGEYLVEGMWMKGELLFGEELIPYNQEKLFYWHPKDYSPEEYYIVGKNYKDYVLKNPKYLGEKSPTWEVDHPILLEELRGDYVKNPILKEYSVHKVFSAFQIWQILSEWLGKQISKKEPIVPVGDDKTRLISAGSDPKTSFRH